MPAARPTQAPQVSIQTQTAPPQITAGMIHHPLGISNSVPCLMRPASRSG